jgi:hypothetical protein
VTRLTPNDLARWRRTLYAGDQLDAATARRIMDEIDALWADLAHQRIEIATKAAAALEKRLEAVATFSSGGCPKCKDAEARAFWRSSSGSRARRPNALGVPGRGPW